MRMILELADGPRLSFETTEGRIYIASDLNSAKKLLAERPSHKTKLEVKERVSQENIVSNRLDDETAELSGCLNWSNKWKSAPTYAICALNEIYQQLLRTKHGRR